MCDVYVLCYCYDMFYVLCHKRPRILQIVKVTALICANLAKMQVNDPPWCKIFKSEMRREFR